MPVPVCARYNSVYPHWRQEMVTNFLFCVEQFGEIAAGRLELVAVV